VKAMEVDEKPTEDYNDIGGLEKQVITLQNQFMAKERLPVYYSTQVVI
jgi:ATP-dependent 26S proteasome regulatory subunit